MDPITISLALIGYLCGSISFAALLARLVAPGTDLTQTEITLENGVKFSVSTVSAMSVSYGISKSLGIVCSLLDMAKAFIPTLAVKLLYPDTTYHLLIAVAVVVGHNWPIFNRFRGGRGFSPIYGGLLVIDWTAIPVSLVSSLLVGLVIRQVIVGFVAALLAVIPWLWFRTHNPQYVVYGVLINFLYLASLIPDIKMILTRYRSGEDLSFVRDMTALDVMPYGEKVKNFLRRTRRESS